MLVVKKLSVKPKTLTIYGEVIDKQFNKERKQNENLKDNKRKGDLSDNSKRRLKSVVDWFIHAVEPEKMLNKGNSKTVKINFITLTISGKQDKKSDYDHNRKVLNHFLVEMRQKYNMQNYVWKLEKQKNGNIHYHIVTDVKVPHFELRQMWNRIQNKFGYVDVYRNKHKRLSFEAYCKMYPFYKKINGSLETKKQYLLRMKKAYEFGLKTDWKQPNSTDIHGLYKIKDVASYVAKYFSKDANVKVLDSENIPRLWGCSHGLSKLKNLTLYVDEQTEVFQDELKVLNENAPKKDADYFTCIYVGFKELVQKGYKNISELFLSHINEFRQMFNYPLLEFVYE